MSTPDSFIEEVTEEVRRDRLFRLFRKYGWIGIALVLAVVGGTAANEWMKSRAEAFGDAVLEALDIGGADERRAALAAIAADGDQAQLLGLILGSDASDDPVATLAALEKVIADPAVAPEYHDLAVLKHSILAADTMPLADRRAALEGIAAAGRPFRALAAEQLAYLLIEEGKVDEAVAALQALGEDQDASGSLKGRAAQVVTALGGRPAVAADPAASDAAATGGDVAAPAD
ncbi:MAG: hypothetical protein WBP18_18420 [Paracoccaceae bacterium]